MIIAVESNFVLELALRQEEAADAERIVLLAEQKQIQLVIPGCALFEPYETLVRRKKQRVEILERVRSEIAQLARSVGFADLLQGSKPVLDRLEDSVEVEDDALHATILRLIDAAAVLPLTQETVRAAQDVRARFEMGPQDAVVFASVDRFFCTQGPDRKVFANRNASDFNPHEAHFQQYNCKLLYSFTDARRFIEHHVHEVQSTADV